MRDILEADLNQQRDELADTLVGLNLVGIGIDLTDVAWAARIIARYPRQLSRIFHQPALDYSLAKKDPAPYLAARMALKEAIVKALGTGLAPGMSWLDMELTRSRAGRPGVILHGRTLERAQQLSVVRWELSIAHRGDYATALAAAIGDGAGDSPAVPPPWIQIKDD